jgi:hypothetical protein
MKRNQFVSFSLAADGSKETEILRLDMSIVINRQFITLGSPSIAAVDVDTRQRQIEGKQFKQL